MRLMGSFIDLPDYLIRWQESGIQEPSIELILMNLKTPYDVFCSTFRASWASRKEDGKDYSFETFCGLLIRAQERLLDEGKL